MNDSTLLLGFDIGGTKIGIGLGTADGKRLGEVRVPNVDTDPDVILPQIAAEAGRLVADAGLQMQDIAAFGISAPYPADAARGIMTTPPNNPKWRNVPILDFLKNALGIPGCFENDANCGALAEWFFGAAKGCNNFIYLTLSTGIGGGIVAAGRLLRGARALSAGEVGHICIEAGGRQCNCGLKGCYEAYCGGRALAQRMRQELKDAPESMIMQLAGGDPAGIDARILVEAVRRNDPYAVALWDEAARRHAQAFGMLISTFNPEKLILGTIAWSTGDLFTDPIKKYLPEFCWQQLIDDCQLTMSGLRQDIGSYAGIAAAMNYLREKENI